MNVQSMAGKVPNISTITNIAYLLGILIVLFIVYKILSAFGLIKTKKKKLADIKKEESVSNFRTMPQFSPSYKDTHSFKSIGLNAANKYAQDLHKAVFPSIFTLGLGTNEELIYSTFGALPNKGCISEIASQYYLRYKRDLRTDLLNDLKEKEIVILNDIINKLQEV